MLRRTMLLSLVAMLATLAFAGTAQALTVRGDHWDIAVEYDCAEDEFSELHAHNDDTRTESPLRSTTFEVRGTSNSIWEETVFGRAEIPLKVIGDGGTYRVGFAVEPVGRCEPPTVTFTNASVLAVPAGERMAGYRRVETEGGANRTRFDTSAGTDRNLGLIVTDHEDLRWGFSELGTYSLSIRATYSGGTIDTQPLTFSVVS